MIPLRIEIIQQALDSYLYGGHLFAIFPDGTLRSLSMNLLHRALIERYPQHRVVIQLATTRGDWLGNPQANAVYGSGPMERTLARLWKNAARENLNVEIRPNAWRVITNVELPIQDIRFYAMRGFIGTRHGVSEVRLNFDEANDSVQANGSLQKIFDAKPLSLASKGGEILISAGNDGLFHGSISEIGQPSHVSTTRAALKSVRTGWAGWDTVNYSTPNALSYIENKLSERTTGPRRNLYSPTDESSDRRSISQFGVSTTEMKPPEQLHSTDIAYGFNTQRHVYFVMRDGTCNALKLQKGGALGVRPRTVATRRGRGLPISSASFDFGVLLEYFASATVLIDEQVVEIEQRPSIAIRTFPGSRRFRRSILSTGEASLGLSVLLPKPAPRPALLTSESYLEFLQ